MSRGGRPLTTERQDRLAAIIRHYGNTQQQGRGREIVARHVEQQTGRKMNPMTVDRAANGRSLSKPNHDALVQFVEQHPPVEEFTEAFEYERMIVRMMTDQYGWSKERIAEVKKYLRDVSEATRKLMSVMP